MAVAELVSCSGGTGSAEREEVFKMKGDGWGGGGEDGTGTRGIEN